MFAFGTVGGESLRMRLLAHREVVRPQLGRGKLQIQPNPIRNAVRSLKSLPKSTREKTPQHILSYTRPQPRPKQQFGQPNQTAQATPSRHISWREVLAFLWRNWRLISALLGAAAFANTLFLSLQWHRYREIVPISGRNRFSGHPSEGAYLSTTLNELRIQYAGAQEKELLISQGRILPDDHPLIHRVQNVLDKIASAAGLDNLHWNLLIADARGKCS